MTDLTVSGLTKSFGTRGSKMVAVDDLNLEVKHGELLVLLGPSGCGKTTTMRALAGLEAPDAGRISFGSQVVFDAERRIEVRPHKRDIGMVFQSYALWPHMTVRSNIAYPLRARRRDGDAGKQVEEAAELVDVGNLLDRYPSQLSGGQQQRVALARALVARPAVMLFDEPLSNLDAKLREQLRADLHRLHRMVGFTGVYVTHDHAEALALGDRLAIMRAGRIEQLGTPERVFAEPATEYVAGFIGIDNVIELCRSGDGWACAGDGQLYGDLPAYPTNVLRLRLRNEDVRICSSAADLTGGEIGVGGATVVDVSFRGRTWDVVVEVDGVRIDAILDRSAGIPVPGETVIVAFEAQDALGYSSMGELLATSERKPKRQLPASATR
jgi:iron(III) transport system ATP-binding protein